MDTQSTVNLLLTRRSVLAANIREPGPSDADLRRILRAGIRVPDHGRIQPWRIQVLKKPGQLRLATAVANIFRADNPDATDKQVEMEYDKPLRAPILLVVTCHPNPSRFDKIPKIEQQRSAAAVCQNILTATCALGYAGQWLTGWTAYHPQIRQALGHQADTDIAGFIYIGSQPEDPPKERGRPEFDDIVSHWDGE
ncbi:MAG: nitroreductase [Gammaproteobacteria bacterium]